MDPSESIPTRNNVFFQINSKLELKIFNDYFAKKNQTHHSGVFGTAEAESAATEALGSSRERRRADLLHSMLKSDFQKDLAITFDSLTWLVHTSVLGYTCSHLRDILEDDTKTKPTKILPLEMDLPTFSLNKRIRPTRSTRALFAIDKVVEYWYLRCINLSRPISVQYHLPEPSSSHKPVKVCPQDHAPTILRDMASVAEIFGDYELVARTLDTFQAYFSTTENLQPFYLRSVIPHFFRSSPEETTDLDICFRKLLVVSICSCTPSETDAHNLSSDERFRSLVRRITDEAQAM